MTVRFNNIRTYTAAALIAGAGLFASCKEGTSPIKPIKKDTFEYVQSKDTARTYPVRNTEDIDKLAERFNATADEFKEYADIKDTKVIYKDTIRVPNEKVKTTFYSIAKKYNVSVDYLHYVLNPQIYNPERIKKGTPVNVPFSPFKERQTLEKFAPNYAHSLKRIYDRDGNVKIGGKTFPADIKGIEFVEFMRSYCAMDGDFKNIPDVKAMKNIEGLISNVLVPIKEHFGKQIEISSGYRGPKLNKIVGGVPNSQHALGEACDISIEGVDVKEVYDWCKKNLKYDQLILEYDDWVHISYRTKGKNRHKAFVIEDKDKK